MDDVVFHCNHKNTYAMKKIGKKIPTFAQKNATTETYKKIIHNFKNHRNKNQKTCK
jgi:hypothetical protein